MSGKLYIAAAGAGKTSKIIKDSLSINEEILIVTYTIANKEQIIDRIKKQVGVIPQNITVSTWFSFLLSDGIHPYQGARFAERIEGIIFVKGQHNTYTKKTDNKYYVSENKIFSDKISECVVDLNTRSEGRVFDRISKIYDYIFIDEVQDLVGYDLEILKQLIATDTEIIMVGDPRQCTYTTHSANKYKKYRNGKIDEFLLNECKGLKFTIDEDSLSFTHRNNNLICNFANKLYPDRVPANYERIAENELDGVKIISEVDVESFLERYPCVQLRDSKRTKVNPNTTCYNFGESKGGQFKRVLIYPTRPMWDWIVDNTSELKNQSRAKLYVAITRAFDTVVIVRLDDRDCELPLISL